jgi:hypothetical protein
MHDTLIDEGVVDDRDVKLDEVGDGKVVDYDVQVSHVGAQHDDS